MRIFAVLFILIFAVCANAERPDPAMAFMSNAQNRLNAIAPSGNVCRLGTFCPPFLQQLETEDFQSRFAGLGFLDSRAPVCQIPVSQSRSPGIVSRFADAAELQLQLARTYPEIGPLNTNTARACATSSRGDASARYRVAKFYMYSKRLNDGATRAVEEIAAINSLLGERETAECSGRGSVNEAFRRCEAIRQNCAAGASQLAAVAAESAVDEEKYKSVSEQITALQRGCLAKAKDFERFAGSVNAATPARNYCEQVFVERQAPQQFCYNYTWQEKQKIQQCGQALVYLQIAKGALEDKNPWFRSQNYFEFRKTKNVAESIRLQSASNRTELRKKIREFEGAALCINGASSASACDTDHVRTVLASTPEIPESFSGDQKANAATLYLGAQSCIEEAVRDQTQTAATLRGLAGDAALTVATAGLSGYAIAARSAVAVSRGARIAGIAALSIDGYYASQSYAAVVKACSGQVNKIATLMNADPNTQCPGPKANASQAQREYSSCAANAAFAALDSLPLVPFIPKIANALRTPVVRPLPSAVTGTAGSSLRERASLSNTVNNDWRRYQNQDLARVPVTRRITPSNSAKPIVVNGRSYEGENNSAIEFINYKGRPAFVKVTHFTAADSSMKLDDEVFYADLLGREGMGPRLLGSFTGADGNVRIATEFIDGTPVHVGFIPDNIATISADSIDQMEALGKKLLDSGITPMDLQFRLDKNGRPWVIDPAFFEQLRAGDYQFHLDLLTDSFNQLREAKGLIAKGTTERLRAARLAARAANTAREREGTRRP